MSHQGHRERVLQGIKNGSGELHGNREIVMAARLILQFVASRELRGDHEVVLEAVRQDGGALEFATEEELRADSMIVVEAVRRDGMALEIAAEELRAKSNIVLEAVRQNGRALRFASEELRANREIVLEAVRRWGFALMHASEELRGNREIVLAALENVDGPFDAERILEYVPRYLRNDPILAGAMIGKGLRLPRQSEIMERLENVLLAVRTLPKPFVEYVVDEESAVEFSRRWISSVWHKIWLALQLEPPGTEGTGHLLMELSNLPLELQLANELRRCAPVIGAVCSAFPDRDWKDLDSYVDLGITWFYQRSHQPAIMLLQRLEESQIERDVCAEFSKGFEGLPGSVRHLTSRTLRAVLDSSTASQRAWLNHIRAVRQLVRARAAVRAERAAQKRAERAAHQRARKRNQARAQRSFMKRRVRR